VSFTIDHNMMAIRTTRNLNNSYNRLAKSTERLSSGLRVNSAADDAAGFAVRELMRSDIETINQGIRNAADAISMLQTAEGALSVIDEKLTRMKELATQAASGTYTTAQRSIINSEYQAMAAEIDRIASAADFNGVKLLDGSLKSFHAGSGIKIHFGTGNSRAEDYYFVNLGDLRATSSTGLRVGNSDPMDIWRTTALNATNPADPLYTTAREGGSQAGVFGLQYTSGVTASGDPTPCGGPGIWQMYGYVGIDPSCESITDVVAKINQGSQANGTFNFLPGADPATLDGQEIVINGQHYQFDQTQAFTTSAYSNHPNLATVIGLAGTASAAEAIERVAVMLNSHYTSAGVFAAVNGATLQVFATQFGVQGNEIDISASSQNIKASDRHLKGGGETPLTASVWWDDKNQEYELQLTMGKGGERYQARIFALTTINTLTGAGKVIGDPSSTVGYLGILATDLGGLSFIPNYGSTDSDYEWSEAQNGSGRTDWNGADILTQSAAQLALQAIDQAIALKDMRRTELGAYINRLENTITNLQIQAENLQYAESRISDMDVASEMVEYSRDQILVQAGVALLSQANAFPKIVLDLIKF
jgi:flagellin